MATRHLINGNGTQTEWVFTGTNGTNPGYPNQLQLYDRDKGWNVSTLGAPNRTNTVWPTGDTSAVSIYYDTPSEGQYTVKFWETPPNGYNYYLIEGGDSGTSGVDYEWILHGDGTDFIITSGETVNVGAGTGLVINIGESQGTVQLDYSHQTAPGYNHIPSGGASGEILGYAGTSGHATWTDGGGVGSTDITTTHLPDAVLVDSSTGNGDYVSGATTSASGVITTGTQTFDGAKTFVNDGKVYHRDHGTPPIPEAVNVCYGSTLNSRPDAGDVTRGTIFIRHW